MLSVSLNKTFLLSLFSKMEHSLCFAMVKNDHFWGKVLEVDNEKYQVFNNAFPNINLIMIYLIQLNV